MLKLTSCHTVPTFLSKNYNLLCTNAFKDHFPRAF